MPIKTGWERLHLEYLKDAALPEPHPVTPEPPHLGPIPVDWKGIVAIIFSIMGGLLVTLALEALGLNALGCLVMVALIIWSIVSLQILDRRKTRIRADHAARYAVYNDWLRQEAQTYVNSLTFAQRQVYDSIFEAKREADRAAGEELRRNRVPLPSYEQQQEAKVRERYYEQNPWARERDNLL